MVELQQERDADFRTLHDDHEVVVRQHEQQGYELVQSNEQQQEDQKKEHAEELRKALQERDAALARSESVRIELAQLREKLEEKEKLCTKLGEQLSASRRQEGETKAEVEGLKTDAAEARLSAQQAREELIRGQASEAGGDALVKAAEVEELRAVLEVKTAEIAELKKWGEVRTMEKERSAQQASSSSWSWNPLCAPGPRPKSRCRRC
jgi:hypothetical protein